jgi:hypothetical protein
MRLAGAVTCVMAAALQVTTPALGIGTSQASGVPQASSVRSGARVCGNVLELIPGVAEVS